MHGVRSCFIYMRARAAKEEQLMRDEMVIDDVVLQVGVRKQFDGMQVTTSAKSNMRKNFTGQRA